MIILAFDLATKTGVCIGESGGVPSAFTVDFGKGVEDGLRFSRAITLAHRMVTQHRPDLVAIESPVGGKDANAYLIGLVACVEGQSVRMGVRVVKYFPSTVRRHFLGKALTARDFPGKTRAAAKGAIKAQVIARCELLGWRPDSADSADSMALWDYAASQMSRAHQMTTVGGLFR